MIRRALHCKTFLLMLPYAGNDARRMVSHRDCHLVASITLQVYAAMAAHVSVPDVSDVQWQACLVLYTVTGNLTNLSRSFFPSNLPALKTGGRATAALRAGCAPCAAASYLQCAYIQLKSGRPMHLLYMPHRVPPACACKL